jgi:para-aminobenzoate synthetase component 1
MDLNVAIRTAIISRGRGYFAVGGGVVYDSREEDEYE